jgi:multicomponent Na+:H+ antiporter subunit G
MNPSLITMIAGTFCAMTGCFFILVGGVGVLKFPDAYCRAHALGKALTLGIIFLLLSLGFFVEAAAWWKITLGITFQLVTIPVASHLFCLIAYRRKMPRWSSKGWVRE